MTEKNQEFLRNLEQVIKEHGGKEFKPGIYYNEPGDIIDGLWENKPYDIKKIDKYLRLRVDKENKDKVIGVEIINVKLLMQEE